jgi:hypothetical protein
MTSDDAAAGGSKTGPLPFDTGVAHQARMYDYVLGGNDNYAADRAAVEAGLKAWPDMAFSMRANRAFLGRVVRYLAGQAGIRQFLDIGTGIPTAGNTHEVAQAIAPESRVVYVDYDHSKSGCAHMNGHRAIVPLLRPIVPSRPLRADTREGGTKGRSLIVPAAGFVHRARARRMCALYV